MADDRGGRNRAEVAAVERRRLIWVHEKDLVVGNHPTACPSWKGSPRAVALVRRPLLDRKVDIIEAMATSFTAVILNLPTMIVWAAILVVLTVAGMALFYVGLVVTLPLAGYATWHAYRAVITLEENKAPA